MARACPSAWRVAPVVAAVALVLLIAPPARATSPATRAPVRPASLAAASLSSPRRSVQGAPTVYPPDLKASPALPHGPAFLEAASNAARQQPAVARVDAQTTLALPLATAQSGDAQGVDIAAYQDAKAPINWPGVATQFQFAYIKATEVDATTGLYVNPYYSGDFSSAMAAGLYVGGYAFATPDVASGSAEAQDFLDQTAYHFAGQVLVPMLDLEDDPYGADPCYGLSPSAMVGWIAAYSQEIQAVLGRAPVIYTGINWWNQCTGGSSAFDANPLWIADYGVSAPSLPAGFSRWELWQSGVGSAGGITGPADLDEFDGGLSALVSTLTDDSAPQPTWTRVPNGTLTSGPALTSWSPSRYDLFGRGTDGALWHAWRTGSGWSNWESLDGQIEAGTSPAAVAWGNNRIDVFIEGTDRQLWHIWWTGTGWSSWEPLGGILTSGPAVASWAAGRLDVVAAGAGGDIYHTWWDGARWNGWESLGGGTGFAPAITAWGPGRLDIFVDGTDGQLWHDWYSAGWVTWEGLGNALTAGPAAASVAPGELDVAVPWRGGQLYGLKYAGDWGFWEAFLGQESTTHSPALVSLLDGATEEVCVTDTSGFPQCGSFKP